MRVKARLLSLWEAVWTSYWFMPALMAFGAAILSVVMLFIDQRVDPISDIDWLAIHSAEGARSLLSAIAASMIGIAGVVFSITIVALTLASSQFGPRLLRNFMRDTGNKLVLGTFIAAFLYCLLLLRQVRGDGDDLGMFVPQLSVLFAVAFAVAGLGVLIYFIHHAAQAIQAPNVIASVSRELQAAIDRLYPKCMGDPPTQRVQTLDGIERQVPDDLGRRSRGITAPHEGYIQRIEPEELLKEANRLDIIIRIERRPGHFVQKGEIILSVYPRERFDDELAANLRQSFTISVQRSISQDAEFAVEQLVEIAVRALSPGINDPFSAMQCIDRLAAALSVWAERQMPSPFRIDGDGKLRVIAYRSKFANVIDQSFNQIRQNSAESLDVMLRLLEALERIARPVCLDDDRECLRKHAVMVYEQAHRAFSAEPDRLDVQERYESFQAALASKATIDQADS